MIREITMDDLSQVVDICYAFFYEGHYMGVGKGSPEHAINYAISWIDRECSNFLGYFKDGVLQGFLVLDITYTLWDRPVGSFSHFIIKPDARGVGIAHKLIEHALELCDNANCIQVYAASTGILTERQNRLFVRLMKRYGFEPYSTMLRRG